MTKQLTSKRFVIQIPAAIGAAIEIANQIAARWINFPLLDGQLVNPGMPIRIDELSQTGDGRAHMLQFHYRHGISINLIIDREMHRNEDFWTARRAVVQWPDCLVDGSERPKSQRTFIKEELAAFTARIPL